jgi:hypothetical protein
MARPPVSDLFGQRFGLPPQNTRNAEKLQILCALCVLSRLIKPSSSLRRPPIRIGANLLRRVGAEGSDCGERANAQLARPVASPSPERPVCALRHGTPASRRDRLPVGSLPTRCGVLVVAYVPRPNWPKLSNPHAQSVRSLRNATV